MNTKEFDELKLMEDSQNYPRVSRILDKTTPMKEIVKWKKVKQKYEENNGEGSWDKNSIKSRKRGTSVHAILEQLCEQNKECSLDKYKKIKDKEFIDDYAEYQKQALIYHKTYFPNRDIIFTEKKVVNHSLQYRGTPDLCFKDLKTNKIVLGDYKTYKGYINPYKNTIHHTWKLMNEKRLKALEKRKTPVKNYRDWDYIGEKCHRPFVQTMMYKMALEDMGVTYNDELLVIDELLIIVISPYGVQELFLPMEKMAKDCEEEVVRRVKSYHKKEIVANV